MVCVQLGLAVVRVQLRVQLAGLVVKLARLGMQLARLVVVAAGLPTLDQHQQGNEPHLKLLDT